MSFHVLICHLYIFFSGISLVSFAHFLIELFFDGYFILRILGTSLFSYIWFANIFSHLLTFYFYLLNKVFHRESCLMLINSDLSVFPLMDDTFDVNFNNSFREGNGNPPQNPCLENAMDGGAW